MVSLIATYRVQLEPRVTFDDVAALAPSLARLGVSHVYASPLFAARSASRHGYDVVDPARFSDELGGRAGFERMRGALREHGLGLVLDIVPNHMAASVENAWWRDVLEHGPDSEHARTFDIDWTRGRVLLPILEDTLEQSLGEMTLVRRGSSLVLVVKDLALPLASRSLAALRERAGDGAHPSDIDDERLVRIARDRAALSEILALQHYELACWREAPIRNNYRRFFDIADLVGVRVEDPSVFDAMHALLLDQVEQGAVDGVRVDHVDGLADPRAYLARLRQRLPTCTIHVEKILHADETLRREWPVDGTTGYEFMRLATGLFVDPAGEEPLTRLLAEITGETRDFDTIACAARLAALDTLFPADVARLADLFQAAAQTRRVPVASTDARCAVRELVAALPVYRTYVEAGEVVHADDRRWLQAALHDALGSPTRVEGAPIEGLAALLLEAREDPLERDLVARLQQLAPAVAAKGVEDTALYRYPRLLALNEVGGDPRRFGVSIEEFHRAMQDRAARTPRALSATSTHDSKRSEDVRARLAVLSEVRDTWRMAVLRWLARDDASASPLPDRHSAYTLYQTLVGAWPIDVERVQAVMLKSAREAKTATSWLAPDAAYEARLRAGVARACADPWFRREIEALVASIARAARSNTLAQLVLKAAAPGVPDFYQGSERAHFVLVDPDNREPVDFARLRWALDELERGGAEALASDEHLGLAKLHVTRRVLALRRARPDAFDERGTYTPVRAHGPLADHVLAFERSGACIAAVPRLVAHLDDAWERTRLDLPAGSWRDVLTGERHAGGAVMLARLWSRLPVSVLEREGSP